jgi:hypothetical protein
MGYGYAETFLIIFLTHPGVIIPTSSSMIAEAAGSIPPEFADLVPTGGFPPIMSGLWQVLWVWILGLPGAKSAGFGWTMYAIYLVFLLFYMYWLLKARIAGGW